MQLLKKYAKNIKKVLYSILLYCIFISRQGDNNKKRNEELNMKRKFVELSGFKRWTFRGGSDIKHTMTIWYFLDFWLITKENDNSRCIDFKQLLKMQALAVLYG